MNNTVEQIDQCTDGTIHIQKLETIEYSSNKLPKWFVERSNVVTASSVGLIIQKKPLSINKN